MSTLDLLRTVPLFQGMTDRSVERIADLVRPATYAEGDVLAREGEEGETFIVLTSGSAAVSQDGRPLRALGGGDFLGEISLVDGRPRTATVTAASPIEALVIDRAGFEHLMSDFPAVRLELVSALTTRLRQRSADVTD